MKIDVFAKDFSDPDSDGNFQLLAFNFFIEMGYGYTLVSPGTSQYTWRYPMKYQDESSLKFMPVWSSSDDATYIVFATSGLDDLPVYTWENESLTHASGLNSRNNVYWIRQLGTGTNNLKIKANGIFPFYIGSMRNMPDDIRSLLDVSLLPVINGNISNISQYTYRSMLANERLYDFVVSNEQVTNTNVDNNNIVTSQVSDKISDLHTFETDNETNLNNQLSAIQPLMSGDTLINNNKFLQSALWVTRQYNRIVLNTPFESVIVLCLILGLCLVIVGKVRR